MNKVSLKQKTLSGLFWSFSDNILNYSVNFLIGIILARLLSPEEFGLIGMIAIFIAVSQTFIDSGFGTALIRKTNATNTDFSTIFYFNLLVGIIFYALLFLFSKTIGKFYDEPILVPIIRIFGLNILIVSLTLIQRTRLTKQINFKLQTKISVTSSVISGLIGIYLAYKGFGVWSLVWRNIINSSLQSILLWIFNKWIPSLVFSLKAFKEMFAFSSRILASELINTLYRNIYLLVIGKYFSARELGFYTRADQFKKLPSENITAIIQRVSYPVLSTVQNNPDQLKSAYKKLIKTTMFLTFISMLGMAAVAEPMILTLIGEKWRVSISYLQLLCFVGMLYPLQALNLNILNVKGRSDLLLRIEIIKKFLAVPIIIIGILINIHAMIIGMIITSLIGYFINSYYSGRLINYSMMEQIRDIVPSFLIACIMSLAIYLPTLFISIKPIITLSLQIFTGGIIIIILSEINKLEPYLEMKQILLNKIKQKKNIYGKNK